MALVDFGSGSKPFVYGFGFQSLWYIVLFRVQNEMEYLAPLMENIVVGVGGEMGKAGWEKRTRRGNLAPERKILWTRSGKNDIII